MEFSEWVSSSLSHHCLFTQCVPDSYTLACQKLLERAAGSEGEASPRKSVKCVRILAYMAWLVLSCLAK